MRSSHGSTHGSRSRGSSSSRSRSHEAEAKGEEVTGAAVASATGEQPREQHPRGSSRWNSDVLKLRNYAILLFCTYTHRKIDINKKPLFLCTYLPSDLTIINQGIRKSIGLSISNSVHEHMNHWTYRTNAFDPRKKYKVPIIECYRFLLDWQKHSADVVKINNAIVSLACVNLCKIMSGSPEMFFLLWTCYLCWHT